MTHETVDGAAAPAVQRRAKGLARIELIVDAAAVVFARDGLDRATTNAIAAEAGISPGSLYQFFDNKQAIARELGGRYTAMLDEIHAAALAEADASSELPALLDLVLDPLIAFKDDHAAFATLFGRTDLPPEMSAPVAAVEQSFERSVGALLEARRSPRDPELTAQVTATIFAIIRGVIAQLGSSTTLTREVKLAIVGYLHERGYR